MGKSSVLCVEVVQQFANFPKLGGGYLSRTQCLQNELLHRSAKKAVQEVANHLPLGPLRGQFRLIDVTALAVLTHDQSLFSHDLQKAEDRRVCERLGSSGVQMIQRLAHGAWPASPEDSQDGELGIGGAGRGTRRISAWHGKVEVNSGVILKR